MSTVFKATEHNNLKAMPIPPDKSSTFMHFTAEKDLLDAVEDFRFKHRFDRRSSAIKWLLRWAIKQDPTPDQGAKEKTFQAKAKKQSVKGGETRKT